MTKEKFEQAKELTEEINKYKLFLEYLKNCDKITFASEISSCDFFSIHDQKLHANDTNVFTRFTQELVDFATSYFIDQLTKTEEKFEKL